MGSLRDQLVAKGLVSKKDRRRVDQQQRDERKKKQGKRRKQKAIATEQAAAAAAAAKAAEAERAARREDSLVNQQALDRRARVRQLVFGNRLGGTGDLRFFFKTRDGRHLRFLRLPQAVAWSLRCGQAGIVATPERDEYVVVRAKAVRELHQLAPDLVVFYVQDTKGISDPSEGFNEDIRDVSLRCHRAW